MTEQQTGSQAVAHMQATVMRLAEKPKWVQDGEWSWRSFTAGDWADKTVLMVSTKGGRFQFLIALEWAEFGDGPHGRDDAEALASYIVRGMNELRTKGASTHSKMEG